MPCALVEHGEKFGKTHHWRRIRLHTVGCMAAAAAELSSRVAGCVDRRIVEDSFTQSDAVGCCRPYCQPESRLDRAVPTQPAEIEAGIR